MSDKYPPPPNYYTDFGILNLSINHALSHFLSISVDSDDFHLDPPVPTESTTIAFEEPIMSFV